MFACIYRIMLLTPSIYLSSSSSSSIWYYIYLYILQFLKVGAQTFPNAWSNLPIYIWSNFSRLVFTLFGCLNWHYIWYFKLIFLSYHFISTLLPFYDSSLRPLPVFSHFCPNIFSSSLSIYSYIYIFVVWCGGQVKELLRWSLSATKSLQKNCNLFRNTA